MIFISGPSFFSGEELVNLRSMKNLSGYLLLATIVMALSFSCTARSSDGIDKSSDEAVSFEMSSSDTDFIDGTVHFYYPDSKTLKRTAVYHNGVLSGPEVCYYPDGVTKGIFYHNHDASPLGVEFFYPGGRLMMKIDCSSGDRRVSDYYDNGQISEEFVLNNSLPQGEYRMYYPDGKIKKRGAYDNGEMSGVWEFFDADGNLIRTISY